MRRTLRRALAALGAAALTASVLSGCVPWFLVEPPPTESVPTDEDVSAELEPYYHQVLAWSGCGDGMQCATAIAPLDWADPAGDTIELALVRQYATGREPIGSLLVNPGGPGGSGVDFIKDSIDFATSERLQERFSVVGFDPRGVGASTPIRCTASDAELDEAIYGIVPGERGTDEWLAASASGSADFAAGCALHTGELLAHVDTMSAVRDLDMLRAALGDETLNYLGYSYGTTLGVRYAELFPERAGRLVLDGAVDPAATESDITLTQARGFESALTAYLEACPEREACRFGASVDAARDRIIRMLADLDADPIPADDGRMLGAGTMFSAIILPLYDQETWSYLDELFAEVADGGTDTAFFLADAYNDRSADGRYSSNGTEAFQAITCIDHPGVGDVATLRAEAAVLAEESPVFGPYMAYGTLCAQWPYAAELVPAPVAAPGSPDILVIGTTNDPATPYVWAEAMASQLENGHLVTYRGEGHTAYGKSDCVDGVVDDFLVDGTVPAADPVC